MKSSIVIAATALAAPNGLDSITVSDSVRAGITMISRAKISGHEFSPLTIGTIPDDCFFPLKQNITDQHRLTHLESRLISLAGLLKQETSRFKVPKSVSPQIILGLPDNLGDPEMIANLMALQLDITTIPGQIKALTRGRAGGMAAVHEACVMIDAGKADVVIAGGIDSYNDIDLLGILNTQARIKTATSIDRFIPGEGAGLLYLMTEEAARYLGLSYYCRIICSATGFEPGHLYSQEPCRGAGLSKTFQEIFTKAGNRCGLVQTVYGSMNGESYWPREWGIACIRNSASFHETIDLHHPAEWYGDPGASSGPLMIGCALKGFQYDYLQGPVLLYASSDHGHRAAILLEGGPEISSRQFTQ